MGDQSSSSQHDADPAAVRPRRPVSAMRVYVLSAAMAAGVVLFAAAFFAVGFVTHAALDDDEGGTSVQATGNPGSTGGGSTPIGEPSPAQGMPQRVAVTVDDDPYMGPVDAPVTMIEFSDFQCPYCSRFRDQTLDQIMETYEGKVRLVYRDFPLSSIHPWAQKAAEAAECADDQGKFWEYHDLIFESQGALNGTQETEGLEGVLGTFRSYAADLGLDTTTFNDCLDSDKYAAEVQKDLQDGQAAGVTGTPGFFINGVEVKGAQPFAAFQQVIDAALLAEAGRG